MTISGPIPKTILVLSTGNSARSIMAEAYLNHIGQDQTGRRRWRAVSAGSKPTGRVNPFALKTLLTAGIPAPASARSKSWHEFTEPSGGAIDVVLTVCDNAAGETCPYFPGPARKIHLGFPDPAATEGSDTAKAESFRSVFAAMGPKLDALMADLNR